MAIDAIITDGLIHASAGMVLALKDFLTPKLLNSETKRLAHKQACLQSMEILLDAEPAPASNATEEPSPSPLQRGNLQKDSTEYAEHVAVVREYLRTSGIVKLQLPLLSRLKDGLRNLILHEKINPLTNMQKLGVAFGVEVFYDVLFDFRYQGMAGLAATLYQVPAFFVGLWVGNGVKKVLNFLITSADEKKLDQTIRQLLRETPIVDLIVKYVPSEQVKHELASRGIQVYMAQLTQVGKGAYHRLQQIAATAQSTADNVMHFAEKQDEKEQQARAARQKRFDELTKGR